MADAAPTLAPSDANTDALVQSLMAKFSTPPSAPNLIPFQQAKDRIRAQQEKLTPPPEPTLQPVPQNVPPPQITDPIKAMSPAMLALAGLAGAVSGGMTGAAQNLAGFVNGLKSGDAVATKDHLDEFNTKLDAALKANSTAIDQYKLAFQKYGADSDKLKDELASISDSENDAVLKHTLDMGDFNGAWKIIDGRQKQQELIQNHADMLNLRIGAAWKDATLHLTDGTYVSGEKNNITGQYRDAQGNDIAPGKVSDTLTGIPAEAIIKPDAAKQAAELALKGDWRDALNGVGFGNAANLNRAIIREAIQKQAAAKGMTGGDLANVIGQFDALVAGYRSAGQLSGRLTVFASEAQQAGDFLKEVNDQFPKDQRTQYKDVNSLVQAFQTRTGGTQVIALGGALNSFANSYMRVASGGGTPRLAYYDHAMDILNKAYSQGQLDTGIETLQAEIERALQAPGTAMQEFQKVLQGTAGTGESAASQAGRVLTNRPAPSENDPFGLR